MKRKCVVVLAILVLMQVLCGVQSAPKAQTAGEKKPTIDLRPESHVEAQDRGEFPRRASAHPAV